ncbi:MAG: hypothetical protein SFY92_11770 [Verrucomicrobiae bacterium]|nr:hypothetical protein [Verrucomicrobiae bacterium]
MNAKCFLEEKCLTKLIIIVISLLPFVTLACMIVAAVVLNFNFLGWME